MASSKKFFKVLEPRHAAVVVGILGVLGTSIVLLITVGYWGSVMFDFSREQGVHTEYMDIINIVLTVTLVVLLITLSFHIMLLVGALKERRCLLLPWLIGCIIWIVLVVMGMLKLLTCIATLPILTVCGTAAYTLKLVFLVHCWLAVKETYSQLREVNPQHVFKSTRLENKA